MALELVQQQTIGLNQEALTEWIEYREAKKKALSQLALNKTQTIMLGYSEAQQQIMVDAAISNDWTGLHAPPKQQTTRNTTLEQDLTDRSWI